MLNIDFANMKTPCHPDKNVLSIYNEGLYHLDKFFIIFKFILVWGFLYQLNEVDTSMFLFMVGNSTLEMDWVISLFYLCKFLKLGFFSH